MSKLCQDFTLQNNEKKVNILLFNFKFLNFLIVCHFSYLHSLCPSIVQILFPRGLQDSPRINIGNNPQYHWIRNQLSSFLWMWGLIPPEVTKSYLVDNPPQGDPMASRGQLNSCDWVKLLFSFGHVEKSSKWASAGNPNMSLAPCPVVLEMHFFTKKTNSITLNNNFG